MAISIRILVVEDSVNDAELIFHMLLQGGIEPSMERVETEHAMRLALAQGKWDIVISDFRLPTFSAPDALAVLREFDLYLPFIIVSGTIGETHAVEAMKAGANDYVMKDNLIRLAPAILRAIQENQERRDRRQAVIALRESEARFRNMADSAPVMLWVSDANSRCEYVNQPWLDFTGRSREDELGVGWMENIHPDDIPACVEAFDNAYTARQSFQIEYRMRRHDNEWRWIVDTGTPRFQSDGYFAGYIGTCIDLTERKQAEFEREAMRLENERLMQEQVAAAIQQRTFLKDILYSVTEGRLHLCDTIADLPKPLSMAEESIPISADSLAAVRQLTREASHTYGLAEDRSYDLITAASEASMNAVVHGGNGNLRVYGEKGRVQVWVEDQGKGIDIGRLPRATLERGYSTGNTLGHGFYLILNCADRMFLLTGPQGTTVVLEKDATPPEPAWLSNMAV